MVGVICGFGGAFRTEGLVKGFGVLGSGVQGLALNPKTLKP